MINLDYQLKTAILLCWLIAIVFCFGYSVGEFAEQREQARRRMFVALKEASEKLGDKKD
jgi:hypothetical protein